MRSEIGLSEARMAEIMRPIHASLVEDNPQKVVGILEARIQELADEVERLQKQADWWKSKYQHVHALLVAE